MEEIGFLFRFIGGMDMGKNRVFVVSWAMSRGDNSESGVFRKAYPTRKEAMNAIKAEIRKKELAYKKNRSASPELRIDLNEKLGFASIEWDNAEMNWNVAGVTLPTERGN